MPGFIGVPELLLLGIVVLLVFGPKRLPEMGRSLGRGMREFKDSVTGDNRPEPEIAADEVVVAEADVEPVNELPRTITEPVVLAPREREGAA
jgi:sec-independent protein translocase protein TatA